MLIETRCTTASLNRANCTCGVMRTDDSLSLSIFLYLSLALSLSLSLFPSLVWRTRIFVSSEEALTTAINLLTWLLPGSTPAVGTIRVVARAARREMASVLSWNVGLVMSCLDQKAHADHAFTIGLGSPSNILSLPACVKACLALPLHKQTA